MRAPMRWLPLLLCLLLAAPSLARAHRLNVFSWTENGQVITQAAFSRGQPAKGAHVLARDAATGQTLAEGKSGPDGLFAFPLSGIPAGHGLLITVNAGQGHQNQWKMEAAELGATQAGAKAQDGSQISAPAQKESASPKASWDGAALAGIGERLARMEGQLATINRQLGEASGPSLRDIAGGLGWIMGLVGAAMFFAGRRREDGKG